MSTGIIYTLIARDAASRTFRQVGRAAGGTDRTLSKLAATAKVAGEAIAVGLAAGLAEGAKSAMEFQSEMTRISTQAGATQKDVKVLSKQVLDLGTKTQQGPQQLAESLYHLKSVGMDNVSAMKALKEASDLAAVGHANLEETTNALAGAWRTGIRGATSFHEAVSTVNAIIGAGNMSMDQFNAAIGTGILPSAKEFGLSMKQVGAALALMTDEGIDSASAATRLRMSFSLLGAPSGAAEKQLKKIGLTGLELADAMRGKDGLIGAVQLLKDHLDASGFSASKQSQILSRAFGGGRSSSGILLMLNNLDVLKKKQDQVNKSTSKFDDAVKMQRKTAEAQWHLLTSNLEVMGVRVGTKVLPPVTSFIHFLATDAMPATYRFADAVGRVIPVDKIKKAVGDAKSVISNFLNSVGGGGIDDFMDGLNGVKTKTPKAPKQPIDKFPTSKWNPRAGAPHLGSGQVPSTKGSGKALDQYPHYGAGQVDPSTGRLGKPLATSPHVGSGNVGSPYRPPPVKPLPKSLTSMPHGGSGSVAPLIKPPVKPKAPPKTLAQQIGQQVRIAFTDGIMNVDWDKFGPILGGGLGRAFGWFVGHGAELSKKLGKAIAGIDWVDVGKEFGVIALPLAIGFVDNLFEPLFHVDFWKKHWLDTILAVISLVPIGKFGSVLAKLGSKIPWGRVGEALAHVPWQKIIPFAEKLGEALGPMTLRFNRWVVDLGARLGRAFVRRFPKIAQWISDEMVLLPVRLEQVGKALYRKGTDLVGRLVNGLLDKLPGGSSKFVRAALKWFGRFSLYQTGVNVVSSFLSGAWEKTKDVGAWMRHHLVDPVINWVKSGFGIKSPSRVFRAIGANVVSGFLAGVAAGAKGLGGWIVGKLVTPVTRPFVHAGSWLVSKGSSLVSGFKGGTSTGAKGIGGWITSHVITPVTSRFTRSGSWLVSKGSSLVGGFKGGAGSGSKGIGGWIKDRIITPVTSPFGPAGKWLAPKGKALLSGLRSGISSGMKGMGDWLKRVVVDPVVHAVKKYFGIKSPSRVFMSIGGHLVSGLIKGMSRTNGSQIAKRIFGDMPSALGSIVGQGLVNITSLPGKAMKALGSLGGKLSGLLGKLFGSSGGGGGVSRWSGAVSTVLAMLGAPASALPAVLKRIQMESGGNPNAINLWDSNALAGHPSQGLMQTIPSTFNAYAGPFRSRGITDGLASIYAGVNYAMHQYGGNWIKVMTRPGGYAKGGLAQFGETAWVGERGAELMEVTPKGTRIFNHQDSVKIAKSHGYKIPGYASGTIQNAGDRVTRDKKKVEDAKDALSRAKRRHKGEAAAQKKLEAAQKELKAAEIALANAKRSAKTSISNSIHTGLQKTLANGTASSIASAIKSLATKLLNAGYNKTAASIQKKGAKLEALATKRASVQKTIAAANAYANDQAGNIRDFLSISGTSATDVKSLISQNAAQQKTASSFVALSKSLKAKGASKALLQQLSDAGPGSQLATILGAKNVTPADIDKLNKQMASGNKLATGFGRDMADLMYDSGKDASKGFLTGLKSQEKALGKQMAKLATDLVAQIKKVLKIKSPSRVFHDEIGKNVVLGWVGGMDAHSHLVTGAAQRLANASTGVNIRRRYVPTAAGSGGQDEVWERLAAALEQQAGQPQQLTGQLVLDSGELLGVIKGTVRPLIRESESRQAHRATVGRRA
ncbi:phage tail tape measure protein [Streptomyces sp. NPDC007903]|uniref:phage tail tape measure protein n=1 Tax=Streptomyces sp. NPDC007903 TaxID=3364786 RepID=UPI0036EE70A2